MKLSSKINGFLFRIVCFFVFSGCLQPGFTQEYNFIAQHEGESRAVAHYEDYFYFNSGGTVHVLQNLGNNDFYEVNSFHVGGLYCYDVNIDSGMMYVASPFQGLLIYNIINPEDPELIGKASHFYPVPGSSIVFDTILLSIEEEHVYVFDITNPGQPVTLSSLYYENNRYGAYSINNNILYGFAQWGYSGPQYITGYDLSDPTSPQQNVSLMISPNYQSPWISNMSAVDDFLYVTQSDSIKIYDISDTDTIVLLAKHEMTGEITKMHIESNEAYFAISGLGVYIYDISDIQSFDLIGHHSSTQDFYALDVSENHMACGYGTEGYQITDKTDFSSITAEYIYDMTDAVYCSHFIGNIGYMGMKESGLQIIDATDILKPVDLGNLPDIKYIEKIESTPGYLFCAEEWGDYIEVISIEDLMNPEKVGEIFPIHQCLIEHVIDEQMLFVVDSFKYIDIYDLSIPSTPQLLITLNEDCIRLGVDSNVIIMAQLSELWPSVTEILLKLFTLEQNLSLSYHDEIVLGDYNDYRPQQIELNYPYIYVRTYSGLVVLLIDSYKQLHICDQLIWSGSTYDMVRHDNFIFLAHSTNFRIDIIDISDPYNIAVLDTLSSMSGHLSMIDDALCITGGYNGYYFYGDEQIGFDEINIPNENFSPLCYPNPCNTNLTIEFADQEVNFTSLMVFSIDGEKVIDESVQTQDRIEINTTSFSQGVYIYTFSSEKNLHTGKFVVSR